MMMKKTPASKNMSIEYQEDKRSDTENSANETTGLDPQEKLLLERFNYGGTTTLRNSLNKEAATKLTKLNHLVGPRDNPHMKGASSDNDSGWKAANLTL